MRSTPVNEAWAGAASMASAMVRRAGMAARAGIGRPSTYRCAASSTVDNLSSGFRPAARRSARRPNDDRPRVDDAAAMILTRIVRAAASRPKTTIVLWLLFVVACVTAGGIAGTRTLDDADSNVGESAVADKRLKDAGLKERAAERILVRSADAARTAETARDLRQKLRALPEVATAEAGGSAGSTALVVVTLGATPRTRPTTSRRSSARSPTCGPRTPAPRCSRPATARARTRSTTCSRPTSRRPSAPRSRSRSSCC